MSKYNSDIHHRRSIRLSGYDYRREGVYYVTFCVLGKKCMLGDIHDGEMLLSTLGCVVDECWTVIPDHFSHVILDEYVIMPNHLHGIIIIKEPSPVRARHVVPPNDQHEVFGKPRSGSLATIIRSFKAITTRRINHIFRTPGERFWQRNFYEHIVRNEQRLYQIRAYIMSNPANWAQDSEYKV